MKSWRIQRLSKDPKGWVCVYQTGDGKLTFSRDNLEEVLEVKALSNARAVVGTFSGTTCAWNVGVILERGFWTTWGMIIEGEMRVGIEGEGVDIVGWTSTIGIDFSISTTLVTGFTIPIALLLSLVSLLSFLSAKLLLFPFDNFLLDTSFINPDSVVLFDVGVIAALKRELGIVDAVGGTSVEDSVGAGSKIGVVFVFEVVVGGVAIFVEGELVDLDEGGNEFNSCSASTAPPFIAASKSKRIKN